MSLFILMKLQPYIKHYCRQMPSNLTRPVTRGLSPPENFFAIPGKMRWTYLKTLGPSQKTLRPPGVPNWLRAWIWPVCVKQPVVWPSG